MKTSLLAPQYILPIDENNELYILWFKKSNSYIIVSHMVLDLLKAFLNKTKKGFLNYLNTKEYSKKLSVQYYSEMSHFLEQENYKCKPLHVTYEMQYLEFKEEYTEAVSSTTNYLIYNKYIQISFPNTKVKNLVHPQLVDYEVPFTDSLDYQVFHLVYDTDNANIILYLNKVFVFSTPLSELHVFLGKFLLQVINILYSKKEDDWLATFHASTVAKDNDAIMCIGKSGSGKSTLCALLNSNGYDVVADDMTPMLASSLEVYRNPSAISIKKGAFEVLSSQIEIFNSLIPITSYKGAIKFLPVKNRQITKPLFNYKCNKVVLVNFDKDNEEASLEVIPKSVGLEVLIGESWISNKTNDALQFLKWINRVTFFKLTYSKEADAIKYFEELETF